MNDPFGLFTSILKRWKISSLNDSISEPFSFDIKKQFLNNFVSQIPEIIIPLTTNQKNEIFSNYKKVSSLPEMKKFCMKSKSIYLQTCLWLMENEMPAYSLTESHHIFPKFLNNNKTLNKKQILICHNEIKVPRHIHMYLHLLRYQEYRDAFDSLAVFISLGKLVKNKNKYNLSALRTFIENEFRQNSLIFEEIQKQQLIISSLGGRTAALNRTDQKIVNMVNKKLTWKNLNYNISECTINPLQQIDSSLQNNFILRDYVYLLMEHLPEKQHPSNWQSEKNLKKWVRSLKNYLVGNSNQTTFLGWELINISSNMEKAQKAATVKQSLKTTNKQNLKILQAKNYIWYNIYFPDYLPKVNAKKNNFGSIAQIANYLLNLLKTLPYEERESKKLNGVLNEYYSENIPGTRKSQINRRFSEVFSKKRVYAYGWSVDFY